MTIGSTSSASSLAKRESGARAPRRQWGVRAAAFSYLTILLIIPLVVILRDGLSEGLFGLFQEISRPVAWSALKLTFWTSAVMVAINTIMGTLTAYVLVRYEFPGRSWINAIVDLPLAIPTLVTGVMLVVLYGPQQALGGWFKEVLGFQIIFAPPGIVLALLFITFPFVVRAVQPVLLELDRAQEDAAATLGANSWTILCRWLRDRPPNWLAIVSTLRFWPESCRPSSISTRSAKSVEARRRISIP